MMIKICDITMKQSAEGFALSFREKIEIAKLLDKLGVSVIEIEGHHGTKTDALRIKSISMAVTDSVLAVPVELNGESVEQTWTALQQAKHARLQVCAPVSSVQMEYIFGKKPAGVLESIKNTVALCAGLTRDVEFIADDATRADAEAVGIPFKELGSA